VAATVAPPAAATPAVAQTPAGQTQVKLQTGLYGQQANAQAQAASLRQAGFSPSIEQRTVNNNRMWAVTVPAGADTNRTIARLREAGFESFPLR
jgi:cell division protein FtsN